jgi:hypothetical protein
MARFGSFKFGQKKFGTESTGRTLTWALEIDWNNDGGFNGNNDATALFSVEVERGRQFFLANQGGGFEPVDIGKMTVRIVDQTHKYDPYNSGSSLAGMVVPGRKFRLRVKRESDGVVLDVISGEIDDIKPDYGANVRTVTLSGVDSSRALKNIRISSAVQSMIRYDDAIEQCLIDAGFTTYSVDGTVSDTMPYWWSSGGSAFSEITSLVDAALGLFFIAADGTPTYLSRLPGDSPVETLTDDDIQRGVVVLNPWEVVRNIVRVYARARRLQSAVELWKLADVPQIPAGESRTIWAKFSYGGEDVAVTSVTAPVATTDYAANTASDGSGTDITADFSVTVTAFAASAKVVVTNNNASAGYVTLLKLRGDAIAADKYTFAEERSETSISTYREREMVIESDWLQDVNTAIEQASVLLMRLEYARQFPRFWLKAEPTKQFLDLFDLITVNSASNNITGEMRVGYIRHATVDRQCQIVHTELHFEPNLTGNISGTWIFPAVFGASTIF